MAPPSVQCQPENDPVYPPAKFFRLPERGKFLIGAQKRFLGHILRVGGIAENTVRYLKNAPLILSNALAKSRFGLRCLGFRNEHTHASPCHASLPSLSKDTASRLPVQRNIMFRKIPRSGDARVTLFERPLTVSQRRVGGLPAHSACLRPFPIRKKRWVGMPEESVATEPRSVRPEVFATAAGRGWSRIA